MTNAKRRREWNKIYPCLPVCRICLLVCLFVCTFTDLLTCLVFRFSIGVHIKFQFQAIQINYSDISIHMLVFSFLSHSFFCRAKIFVSLHFPHHVLLLLLLDSSVSICVSNICCCCSYSSQKIAATATTKAAKWSMPEG